MKNTIITLFALALLYSCTNDKPTSNIFKTDVVEAQKSNILYTLVQSDTLTIPIDSLTQPINDVNIFVQEHNLLIDYNENAHSIQFYSLSSKNKSKDVGLKNEGPFRIGAVTGIAFHDFDSIFLVVEAENKIFLIDTAAQLINQWHVSDDLPLYGKAGYDIYMGEFFNPYYNTEKKQLTIGLVTYLEANKIESYTPPILADFDISMDKVASNYGYNPEEFMKNEIFFLMEEFSSIYTDEYEILNFFGSHNLYFYEARNKKLDKIIKVKSKYLPDRIAGIGKPGIDLDDMQMQSKYYIEAGRYINFLHDPYRNVYYRVVKKPSEFLTIDGKQRSFDSFQYSIMILDSDFNISNEIDLTDDTFDFHLMFVDKQGLWICINNPNNKQVSEDEMKLVLFTLK